MLDSPSEFDIELRNIEKLGVILDLIHTPINQSVAFSMGFLSTVIWRCDKEGVALSMAGNATINSAEAASQN